MCGKWRKRAKNSNNKLLSENKKDPKQLSLESFLYYHLLFYLFIVFFCFLVFFSIIESYYPVSFCFPNILLFMLMLIGLFLHYIHVGDNSQLCNKNNETNLLNQICNFKNAIHILYSFVVVNSPLHLCAWFFFRLQR